MYKSERRRPYSANTTLNGREFEYCIYLLLVVIWCGRMVNLDEGMLYAVLNLSYIYPMKFAR